MEQRRADGMSEQRRMVSIDQAEEKTKTFLQKLLDGVETIVNKVPHPTVIFFILCTIVILLSHLFYLLGTSAAFARQMCDHSPRPDDLSQLGDACSNVPWAIGKKVSVSAALYCEAVPFNPQRRSA